MWLVNGIATDGKDARKGHLNIAGHLTQLKEKLAEVGVRLVIVDPLVSMQSGDSKRPIGRASGSSQVRNSRE